jgi:chromosome segregation ATPase
MNNKRRQSIKAAIEQLESCAIDLESIKDEEDEYRNNMPENLQASDRYTASEECSDGIESAIDSINEAIEGLGNI